MMYTELGEIFINVEKRIRKERVSENLLHVISHSFPIKALLKQNC